MSSQFNYELDERQIRIMLQNAELDYNESIWQQFESVAHIQQVRNSVSSSPKFNFGISRQILVPAFFVIVICGLSALLFSFVDFKKKEPVNHERLLQSAVINNEDKRETSPSPQPSTKAPIEADIKKDSSGIVSKKVVNTVPEQKQEAVAASPQVTSVTKPEVKKEVVKAMVKKEEPVRKRRKHRRQNVEDMPSINTPINLTSDSKEPEPDIKLN